MNTHTVIIGGGISGLSAANFLYKKTSNFIIVESDSRLGGIINTSLEGGYICENGPNTILDNNPAIIELLKDLNVYEDLIYANNEKIKKRYLLVNDSLTKIPMSFFDFVTTPILSIYSKLRVFFEIFISRHKANTSVKNFISTRFGNEFHNKIIVPFLTGIYADDTSIMSSKNTLKILWRLEQKFGSIIIGLFKKEKSPPAKIFTLDGGLSKITSLLSDKFQNQILLETKVKGIKKESNCYKISFNNREDIVCKNIISTIPAYSLKEIIFDNRIKKVLSKVDYNPIDVFHFGFNKKDIKNEIDGFGLLTKPEDRKSFLGILFSSNIFSHVSTKDKFLMTVLVGGKRQKELCELPPKEIEKTILDEILKLFKISSNPELIKHFRWKNGIPSYSMMISSLEYEIKYFEKNNSSFSIIGNFHLGVSVSDCIYNAKTLIENKF